MGSRAKKKGQRKTIKVVRSTHTLYSKRQVKYATCSENYGIRPPAPEQYLTPLQQKEVCIRHLRARLKEKVERLQDRDSVIGELRMQLTRMQEDWIEEECHRIEAQLALKEARKEIRQLQQTVETVRSNLGAHEADQQDCKSEGLGVGRIGPRFGASRSCGCSPAHTMSRSATFTRLSSDTSPGATDRNGNVRSDRYIPANRGAMTLPRGDGRTHLLLEAALLSEQVPHTTLCSSLSRSSTCERLCSGETVLPVSRSCHAVNNNCSCIPHAYLPHHHLFLHLPQEEAPPPPPLPPPPPPTAPPTSPPLEPPPQEAAVVTVNDEDGESAPPQRSHWSRYFLIDLLAVTVPVVPTLAWLCRGSRNEGMPVYNMGSLLRGCCAVALHSLRRGHSPSRTGRAKPI
uniref:Syntaphilin a n=1 Tax=Sinocyclocheilus rhinocerous TaxID=307959 RepID=A0A673HEI3_9TELE